MNRRAFLLALALPALPAAARQSDGRKAIEALYRAAAKAVEEKDLATLSSLTTESLVLKSGNQTFNRSEWLGQMGQLLQTLNKIDSSFVIQSAKIGPKTAVVVVKQTVRATYKDPQGKTRKLVAVEVARDAIVKEGDKWLLRASTTLSHKETLDGKPVKAPS